MSELKWTLEPSGVGRYWKKYGINGTISVKEFNSYSLEFELDLIRSKTPVERQMEFMTHIMNQIKEDSFESEKVKKWFDDMKNRPLECFVYYYQKIPDPVEVYEKLP